jgi:two-component system chemotaxis response regulator CheY
MNPHILIVDDSPSIRQMVEMTLKSADYLVTAAEDGQAALELCQAHQYQFVLTDQNMPKMDGITLVKSLRAIDNYKRTPIIILTTEASDNMKSQGREAGATGWMVKPFDPNKLLQVTAKVLG